MASLKRPVLMLYHENIDVAGAPPDGAPAWSPSSAPSEVLRDRVRRAKSASCKVEWVNAFLP